MQFVHLEAVTDFINFNGRTASENLFLPSILALQLLLTLYFTLREPNIYKPHGFFWASLPLLFAFVLLSCFIFWLFEFGGK